MPPPEREAELAAMRQLTIAGEEDSRKIPPPLPLSPVEAFSVMMQLAMVGEESRH